MDSLQQYSELLLFSLRRHSGILTHTWLNRHLARSFRVASGLGGRSNSEPSSEQRKANDGTGQLALKQTCTVNHHFTHSWNSVFYLLATVFVDPEITCSAEPGWYRINLSAHIQQLKQRQRAHLCCGSPMTRCCCHGNSLPIPHGEVPTAACFTVTVIKGTYLFSQISAWWPQGWSQSVTKHRQSTS